MLTKLTQRQVVPAIPGQAFASASFNCYPPPQVPPVTPPGPDPGGGNGSGPPAGECYLAPVYIYLISCGGYEQGNPLAQPPCIGTNVLAGSVLVCP